MIEVYIPEEMLMAGVEALKESRLTKMDDEQQALSVYLAMEAIKQILVLQRESGMVH